MGVFMRAAFIFLLVPNTTFAGVPVLEVPNIKIGCPRPGGTPVKNCFCDHYQCSQSSPKSSIGVKVCTDVNGDSALNISDCIYVVGVVCAGKGHSGPVYGYKCSENFPSEEGDPLTNSP